MLFLVLQVRNLGPEPQSIHDPSSRRARQSQRGLNALPGYIPLLTSILLARILNGGALSDLKHP